MRTQTHPRIWLEVDLHMDHPSGGLRSVSSTYFYKVFKIEYHYRIRASVVSPLSPTFFSILFCFGGKKQNISPPLNTIEIWIHFQNKYGYMSSLDILFLVIISRL